MQRPIFRLAINYSGYKHCPSGQQFNKMATYVCTIFENPFQPREIQTKTVLGLL